MSAELKDVNESESLEQKQRQQQQQDERKKLQSQQQHQQQQQQKEQKEQQEQLQQQQQLLPPPHPPQPQQLEQPHQPHSQLQLPPPPQLQSTSLQHPPPQQQNPEQIRILGNTSEGNTSDLIKGAVMSASPSNGCTAIDVIIDFRTLDQNKNGEITALEFMDGLRSNRQLASKFGLSDDILEENGTREKYELKFGIIDIDHSKTVNVRTLLTY
jgi:hypothetical protein